ncbi:MAG TPA: response regulator [Kofleriaceae bacterium]|nr:response regulator [Kofleriaceae bacterium]
MSTVTNAPPLVVLADDDADVREILAERFCGAGFEVKTACHGAEMILLLQQCPVPDAIFVDLLMPGVVGHSVLDFVRAEPRLAHVPVAIVSGSPELAPAGYPLFTKPVRFAPLLQFVRDSIGAGALATS